MVVLSRLAHQNLIHVDGIKLTNSYTETEFDSVEFIGGRIGGGGDEVAIGEGLCSSAPIQMLSDFLQLRGCERARHLEVDMYETSFIF